jgi:hypothetical protein
MAHRGGAVQVAAVAAAVVTGSAALTGCTAQDAVRRDPSAARSTSPSASPAPPTATAADRSVPPAPTAPRFRPGPDGQRDFAAFVRDAWSWSLVSNDAGPLLEVSPARSRPCDGCRALDRELRARAKDGWSVDFPGLRERGTRLRRAGDLTTATTRVDVPESATYFDDGRFRSTNPPHEGARFVVVMRRTPSDYRLVSFRVA